RMTDKGDNDFKVLAVPHTDPIFADYHDLAAVPRHYLREVEHFFATYKQLEDDDPTTNQVETQGWDDVAAAHREILSCIERFETGQKRRDADIIDATQTPQRRADDST
ncbi:MAG: inorganic diphosphatase, partial [Planctomycetota bacterium]